MSESRKNQYFSPLQERYDSIVRHLSNQIENKSENSSPTFDIGIFKKYKVKRFHLKYENEPVEMWVFDQESKPYPIIEDQIIKRGQSILAAVKSILIKENRQHQMYLLDQIYKVFQIAVNQFLDEAINFENQCQQLNLLIKQLINDITFIWGHYHPNASKLVAHDYHNFYKEFWCAVEEVIAPYKNNHILVINKHPNVRAVQFYERGTIKHEQKEYRSAHKRDGVGIPNFIAYGVGHLDSKSENPTITDIGFRHASLPPIDFYPFEEMQSDAKSQDSKDWHVETIKTTTQNMESLAHEMLIRCVRKETKDDKDTKPALNWINVSLLTVHANEKQDKQYHDTLLAGDRIRFRRDHFFHPILFNFGVNWFATGILPTYPADQQFGNQRAFFQLHKLFTEQTYQIILELDRKNDTEKKPFINLCYAFLQGVSDLGEIGKNFEEIEEKIKPFAQAYDKAIIDYEAASQNKLECLAKIKIAETALIKIREACYSSANDLFLKYQFAFDKIRNHIIKHLNEVLLLKKEGKLSPEKITLLTAFYDFFRVQELFFGVDSDKWSAKHHNFELQEFLIDLSQNLNRLHFYYKNIEKPAITLSSWNCKSNNDRSTGFAARVDAIRARRIIPNFNAECHCQGAAWAFAPIIDTDGGGPKFGGGHSESGHPFPQFAKRQKLTSNWATHKLSISYLKKKNPIIAKDMQLLKTEIHKPKFENEIDLSKLLQIKLYDFEKITQHLKIDSANKETPRITEFNSFIPFILKQVISAQSALDLRLISAEIIDHYLMHIDSNTGLTKEDNTALTQSIQDILKILNSRDADEKDLKETKFSLSASVSEQKDASKLSTAVKTYEGWRNEIDSNRGFLNKAKGDSKATKAVDKAYRDFFRPETRHIDLVGQILQLRAVQTAVKEWLKAKHGGSQFKKNVLRTDSRLAAMLALRNHIREEIAIRFDWLKLAIDKFLSSDMDAARKLLKRVEEYKSSINKLSL